eukprot:5933031-Pleurochrysis_carterae.AAC.3
MQHVMAKAGYMLGAYVFRFTSFQGPPRTGKNQNKAARVAPNHELSKPLNATQNASRSADPDK